MKLIGIIPMPTPCMSFSVPVYQNPSNGHYYYHKLTADNNQSIQNFEEVSKEAPKEMIMLPELMQIDVFQMDAAIFVVTSSYLFFVGTRNDFLSRWEFFKKEGGENFNEEFNKLIV